jgi:hypothetical protein
LVRCTGKSDGDGLPKYWELCDNEPGFRIGP